MISLGKSLTLERHSGRELDRPGQKLDTGYTCNLLDTEEVFYEKRCTSQDKEY